jgi:hypothetical protein
VCGRSDFRECIHDSSCDPFDPALRLHLILRRLPGRRVLLFFFRQPFEGLHGVHLPASILYDYIEHTHEISHVNGATDALSISPSA